MDATSPSSGFIHRRSRTRRWLSLGILSAIMAGNWWTHVDGKPDLTRLTSGFYELVRANSDGSLTLAKPDADAHRYEFDVDWLAINFTQPGNAAQWIESQFQESNVIQLRLDRRRLDQDGNLQAYFFKDDLLLNAELIRQGFASEATHPSDFAPISRQIRQAGLLSHSSDSHSH